MAQQETLFIQNAGKSELALREFEYRSLRTVPGEVFEVEISTAHFSATRGLTLADIAAIRDWCTEALEAQEMKVAAE